MIQGAYTLEDELTRRRELLGRITLLRGCPQAALEDLARRIQVRVRPADTLLVAQDEPAEALHLIAAGRVRVAIIGDSGRELTVAELGPGEFFGEQALLSQTVQAANVSALDDVTLLQLGRDAFLEHLRLYPAMAVNLALALSRRMDAATRTIGELALQNVESRLVRTLERLARAQGGVTSEGLVLQGRPTHQELASLVGTCRETITRMLTSLTRRGLLVSRGPRLVLAPELLRRAA
jgi:CRP/FNR family transcriptional regulator, cyclic AMP receptor protein